MPDPLPPDSPVYVPPEGPPQRGPSREIYGRMGREAIYRMCEDFYTELERSQIRSLFPEDMVAASHRNAAFIVGVVGGPPLYRELYGSPQMRARHLRIPIDRAARDVWLGCFLRVLEGAEERYGFPAEHLPGFKRWLEEFSLWMVNRDGPPQPALLTAPVKNAPGGPK